MSHKPHITKHNHQVVFGRREVDCPRCAELLAGAAPRDGWQKQYYSRKRQDEQARLTAIRNHDFAACAAKNIVCTCFDW